MNFNARVAWGAHCARDLTHESHDRHDPGMSRFDWPYSTFHRYVRRGILPTDWAVEPGEVIGDAGEEPPCAMRTLRWLLFLA